VVSDACSSSHSFITPKLQLDFGKFLFAACFGTEAALAAAEAEVHVEG
jgi:hypothetical protein